MKLEEHARLRRAVDAQLATASLDELRVVAFIVQRLIGQGRVAYGALDLATDERDFVRERNEEIADALVYVACAALKSSAGKTG